MKILKKKDIEEKINNLVTVEEGMELASKYYPFIPIQERSKIFNRVIFNRKTDSEDVYLSLKLATNLSFLFVSYPERIRSHLYDSNNMDFEMHVFRLFVKKIHDIYIKQQIDQTEEKEDKTFLTYLLYQFHYPTISAGDYIEMFKLFDDVSKEIYGFSIYDITKMLMFFTSDVSLDNEKKVFSLTNEWISMERIKKFFNIELSPKILSGLFIDETEIKNKMIYPTDILKNFKGKIGIKLKKGFFIPQSYFVFENILRYLIESEKSMGVKGDILENHVEDILKEYFGKENVIKTFYDDSGKEQDILVKHEKYVLSIECKAQDFKEVYRNQKQSEIRLTRRFNNVILKGCQQCERVKESFLKNDSVTFYNSDNKNKRGVVLEIPDTKKVNLIKIVITLDDYLNLSESPHDFLDSRYRDTWIINLFTLKRILWASEPEQFIKYAEYRTSGLKTIRSMNSDELEQFGYFMSPNFDTYPQNDIGITINLGQSFSRVFDKYDNYSYQEEIKEWEEYINKKIKK
ncbi:hypothetical protein [Enterococcus malodoratus]|uniref:hypothetical protein n=1 Tax=Enterococcus malodoratus TaxID=71451 RepID=UPI0039B0873D